jgi:hypothetical protein
LLNECRNVPTTVQGFSDLIQRCTDSVSPEEAWKVARGGNRRYLYQVLQEALAANLKDDDVSEIMQAQPDPVVGELLVDRD